MSIPDFERADYVQPRVIEGDTSFGRVPESNGGLLPALLLGTLAAVFGSVGYALVGLSGFMVSIVAIGVGWLVAKAMMTGSGGVGGRSYQVGAVVLTYFAVSCGDLLHPLWKAHQMGVPASQLLSPLMLKYAALGPLLGVRSGINGALGLLILFFGLRTAWRMAAGGPGFGQGGRSGRMNLFGMR